MPWGPHARALSDLSPPISSSRPPSVLGFETPDPFLAIHPHPLRKKWRWSGDSLPTRRISMTRARSCGTDFRTAGPGIMAAMSTIIVLIRTPQSLELPSPSLSQVYKSFMLDRVPWHLYYGNQGLGRGSTAPQGPQAPSPM